MPLQSQAFRDNQKLQACLVDDQAHLTPGTKGEHVALVQRALVLIDGATIATPELASATYGPSTTSAVLAYKTQRKIINKAYQQTPDAIVGKMTIQSLDDEMRARETTPKPNRSDRCRFAYPVMASAQPAPKVQAGPGILHANRLQSPLRKPFVR